MKKTLFVAMSALLLLAACTGGTKNADDGDNATTEKKSMYDPTDARTFGLVGPVKSVSVSICKLTDVGEGEDPWTEKDTPNMAFDRHGRVTLDPMGNTYEYDAQGKVIKGVRAKVLVRRDNQGRLALYESRDGDNDYEMRSIHFRCDTLGRLLATDNSFWESLYTDSMVYEGDKVYPIKRFVEGQAEAEEYKDVEEYSYTKFDEQGNWTERNVTETYDYMIAGNESSRSKEVWKRLEVRKITYYTEEELNAPTDEAEAATAPTQSVDLAAFGFKGKVKEAFSTEFTVKNEDVDDLEADEPYNSNDSEHGYSFDKDGRITVDPWGGVYIYDADGNFTKGVTAKTKMRRDDKGRVVFYRQANDEDDDAMFKNEFTYDEQGRLKKIERTFWESSQEEEFFYEGDNPYPVRRRYQSSEEGTEVESETEYRYTKFDEQGNWTEREMRYRGDTTEGEGTTTRWRGAMLERRTISYY